MKEPLRTKVYRQLLEMIVSGRLTANSFTNEDALMEITGTSRTPVREAVQKLEASSLPEGSGRSLRSEDWSSRS